MKVNRAQLLLLLLAGAPSLAACDALVAPLQRVPWSPTQPSSGQTAGPSEGDEKVTFAVAAIVKQRCAPCHSATPSIGAAAPVGVALDTPDEILARKDRLKARSVDATTMPPGNSTGMTDAERALLRRWLETFAK